MNDKSTGGAAGLLPLLHAAGSAEAYLESKLGAIDLSVAKLAALSALLDAGESLPLGRLAERLSCVKSNITQLVDRLEADGLVARKPDPRDRRSRLAVVTAAGRTAGREGRRIQQQTERDLFGALTGEETRQLVALMGKVKPRRR
jgi:DNA-binding MarR family transcriptional regulator